MEGQDLIKLGKDGQIMRSKSAGYRLKLVPTRAKQGDLELIRS